MAEILPTTKVCNNCLNEKDLNDYPKNRYSRCKECINLLNREKRKIKTIEKMKNVKPTNPDNKICIECKKEKCLQQFSENQNKCTNCVQTKVCFVCSVEKSLSEFVVDRNNCKPCANKQSKIARDKRNNEKVEQREKEKEIEKQNGKRKCGKCGIEKELTSYCGNYKVCEECRNKDKVKEELPTSKKCTSCDTEKSLDEFPVGRNRCRICFNKQNNDAKRLRNAKKREEKNVLEPKPKVEGNKICVQCNEEKAPEMFRDKRRKCKECEKADGRAYRQSEIGKEKSKDWVEQNQDKMTELQADWYQNNKEKINEKNVEKYHNDEIYRIMNSVRKSASRILKIEKDYFESEQILKYLNCSSNFYLDWIKHCFEDDMNLENHGKLYDIDHVIPIHYFREHYKNNMDICFSWFNTMPLYKKENMKKKEKIDRNQIKIHLENLVKFNFNESASYKKYLKLIETEFL